MAQLVVRNIEEQVVGTLRLLAARVGVSMEEQHRRILRNALLGRKSRGGTIAEHLVSIPQGSAKEPADPFSRHRDLHRKVTC